MTKQTKTLKEWWDESGFGTVVYLPKGERCAIIGEEQGLTIPIVFADNLYFTAVAHNLEASNLPPKKWVKKYYWVIKSTTGSYRITQSRYAHPCDIRVVAGAEVLNRIEESMIEVEED